MFGRHSWTMRLLRWLLAGLLSAAGLAWYFLAALLVSAQPDTPPFNGYAAVIVRGLGGEGRVHLDVYSGADESVPSSSVPTVRYRLGACDFEPTASGSLLHVALVLYGDARLVDTSSENYHEKIVEFSLVPDYHEIEKLTVHNNMGRQTTEFRNVQVWEMTPGYSNRCSEGLFTPGSPTFYTGFMIQGTLGGPIRRHVTVWGIPTASMVTSWPAVGMLPLDKQDDRYRIELSSESAYDGLSPWRTGAHVIAQVIESQPLHPGERLEQVRPQPISPDTLSWVFSYDRSRGEDKIVQQATAVVTNLGRRDYLNRLQVGSGVALGVACSLLAAPLLHGISRSRQQGPAHQSLAGQSSLSDSGVTAPLSAITGIKRHNVHLLLAFLAGGVIIVRLLRRRALADEDE